MGSVCVGGVFDPTRPPPQMADDHTGLQYTCLDCGPTNSKHCALNGHPHDRMMSMAETGPLLLAAVNNLGEQARMHAADLSDRLNKVESGLSSLSNLSKSIAAATALRGGAPFPCLPCPCLPCLACAGLVPWGPGGFPTLSAPPPVAFRVFDVAIRVPFSCSRALRGLLAYPFAFPNSLPACWHIRRFPCSNPFPRAAQGKLASVQGEVTDLVSRKSALVSEIKSLVGVVGIHTDRYALGLPVPCRLCVPCRAVPCRLLLCGFFYGFFMQE
jgi:hypothetical protein